MIINKFHKKCLRRFAILCSCTFFVLLIFHIFFVKPINNELKDIEQLHADTARSYEIVLDASSAEGKKRLIEQIEQVKGKWKNFVIEQDEVSALIFFITNKAKENKLDLFSCKDSGAYFGEPIPGCKQISEKEIKVSFEAEFHNFVSFISELEMRRPVMFINAFSILNSFDENRSHKSDITLKTFVKK